MLAELFVAVVLSGVSFAEAPHVLRERALPSDGEALLAPARVGRGGGLLFAPFDDVRLELRVERVGPGALADLVIEGTVAGAPGGWWRVVVRDDALVGDFVVPGRTAFELRPTGGGVHVVREVDRGRRAECAGALSVPIASASAPGLAPGPLPGPATRAARGVHGPLDAVLPAEGLPRPPAPPTEIDVMVVYTASARSAYGGAAGTVATIDSFVAYANGVYASSGVAQRLRLVHAAEVAYVESGNILTDLARLRNPSDGPLDEVHGLRDAFGADCVVLLTTSGGAGVGYLMDVVSPAFESSAFSVLGAGTSGTAFAHELGHNMGCGHNNGAGVPPAAFCDSFGHRTPDGAWRTIMSYAPGEYVDAFSSPLLEFAGFPLGVDGAGCPLDAADNVRTLNATRAVVAGFRPTVVGG